MSENTDESRDTAAEPVAPKAAPKPVAKAAAPAKKAPAAVPLTPVRRRERDQSCVTGKGGVKPFFDADGRLHVSPQFFTDLGVASSDGRRFEVRRFEGDTRPPYVVIPGDVDAVAVRTGIAITGDIDDFVPYAAVPGEAMVVGVDTHFGEIYLLCRPYGGAQASIHQGRVMAVLEVTNER